MGQARADHTVVEQAATGKPLSVRMVVAEDRLVILVTDHDMVTVVRNTGE